MLSAAFVLFLAHRVFELRSTPELGRVLVAEAGLNAEVLAAAGCGASDAQALAADILANTTGRETRSAALANLNSISQQLANAESQLATNPRDEEAFRHRLALLRSRRSAVESVASAEHSLRTHAVAGLSQGIATMVESGALSRGHSVDAPTAVAMPSETSWGPLSVALRAQRRSDRMGTPLPSRYRSIVQSVNTNTAIATATEHYQANVGAIRTALAQSVDPGLPPPPPPPPDGPP